MTVTREEVTMRSPIAVTGFIAVLVVLLSAGAAPAQVVEL
jgi:hypothetical protein